MLQDLNAQTQPFKPMKVFARWDVIPVGWYAALPSSALRVGHAQSVTLCNQRVAFFRGEDGKVRALDAFCPHMGTDLGIGTVVGNTLRCFFHQWRFDGSGACVHIPASENIPPQARVRSYACMEKYGYIWVYPEENAPAPVADFADLEGEDVLWSHDVPHEGGCHHHISMINGIDPQHLAAVHKIHMQADVHITPREHQVVDYVIEGEMPTTTFLERMFRLFMGGHYSYAQRYADANLGLLTTMREVRLFGHGPLFPALHMIFAYTPLTGERVRTHTIFVTRRRKGVLGWLFSQLVLWMTRQGYYALRGQDAVVYDNIRFQPNALLPMDSPLTRYLAYTNRLKPSAWSRPSLPIVDEERDSPVPAP